MSGATPHPELASTISPALRVAAAIFALVGLALGSMALAGLATGSARPRMMLALVVAVAMLYQAFTLFSRGDRAARLSATVLAIMFAFGSGGILLLLITVAPAGRMPTALFELPALFAPLAAAAIAFTVAAILVIRARPHAQR